METGFVFWEHFTISIGIILFFHYAKFSSRVSVLLRKEWFQQDKFNIPPVNTRKPYRTLLIAFLACFFFTARAQQNLSFTGHLPYQDNLNDIWGYVGNDNKEYAFVGVKTGVSIVDVDDPANPVELFFIPGPASVWREIKIWNDFAYATNETGGGLRIIDLANFPASIDTSRWIGPNGEFWSAHNIQTDENGFAYLVGFNDTTGDIVHEDRGALIIDLNSNPVNPTIVGTYSGGYVHDCFVRGDTMWTAEIVNGYFGVVDVSDKANPVLMAAQATPHNQTHNCWLSDDGQTLFTTDEISGAFVASYDVSDLNNISELDRIQTDPGLAIIPHNTFFLNHYLITSYYTSGVTIVDANRPDNLVEVGKFDTSPLSSADFRGCWGAYPYLPSGNIIASDMQEGLFVLTPTYTRACYLDGHVSDITTDFDLNGVQVEFLGHDKKKFTNLAGNYKTGIGDSGFYTIRFYLAGCETKFVSGVHLQKATTTVLNVEMTCIPGVGTGAEIEATPELQIQPVIFSGQTNIEVKTKGKGLLLITNSSGKMMAHFNLNRNTSLSIGSRLPAGIYIITLVSDHKYESKRIVKF